MTSDARCRPVYGDAGTLVATYQGGPLDERGQEAMRALVDAVQRRMEAEDTPERRARYEAGQERIRALHAMVRRVGAGHGPELTRLPPGADITADRGAVTAIHPTADPDAMSWADAVRVSNAALLEMEARRAALARREQEGDGLCWRPIGSGADARECGLTAGHDGQCR